MSFARLVYLYCDGPECEGDGHPFTNVQSGKYWSSTGDPYTGVINAYAVDLSNGEVEHVLPQATTVYPGWYVREMRNW